MKESVSPEASTKKKVITVRQVDLEDGLTRDLHKKILDAIADPQTAVVLDVQLVRQVNGNDGVADLVNLVQQQSLGGRLKLANLQGDFGKKIGVLRLHNFFGAEAPEDQD